MKLTWARVEELEHRFEILELNMLKGVIGEHLARSFIRNVLAPKLMREEGWNHILLSNSDYKKHLRTWNQKLFRFDLYREDFLAHGFYANTKLLARYADSVGVLVQNRCSPDGLLFKLRQTGCTIRLKGNASPRTASLWRDDSCRHKEFSELPIVEGDLEVVEIKCGRNAKLLSKQRETYNNLMSKGIPIRMVSVKIVSFDTNKFLVEERKFERCL